MQKALLYLFGALLKRRLFLYLRNLRRPLNLLSLLLASTVLGTLFYYRNDEFIGKFVQNTPLSFFLSLLLVVSLVRALMQRGMQFDSSEIEYLFCGPFQQSDLIVYRMMPAYLGSIGTMILFPALFWKHFSHPILTGIAITLFQIICAHMALAASIFSGSLSEKAFSRLRWISWALLIFFAAAWIEHAMESSRSLDTVAAQPDHSFPLQSLIFYPQMTVHMEPGNGLVRTISDRIVLGLVSMSSPTFSLLLSYLVLLPALVLTGYRILRLKTSIFEAALDLNDSSASTGNTSDSALKSSIVHRKPGKHSVLWPKSVAYAGTFGALLWKNLLCALRSKTQLLLGTAYTFAVTASTATVAIAIGKPDPETAFEHYCLIPVLLSSLPFLLQTALPFDLRLDRSHISNLRMLPMPPLALAAALISIPTILCLAYQSIGLMTLTLFTDFPWSILIGMIFGFPAITASIHIIWNIYYAVGAEHQQTAPNGRTNAIAMFLVLCTTGFLLYPGGYILRLHVNQGTLELGLAIVIALQYAIDAALLVLLSKVIEKRSFPFASFQ